MTASADDDAGKTATGGAPEVETAASHEVRAAALGGVRWGATARLGIELAALLSSVVLARLVSVSGFGDAAVAVTVVILASALVVEGFGTPLVQRQILVQAHVEVAALLSLITGAVLTGSCLVLAPLLRRWLNADTVGLIRLASAAFILVSIMVVPQALQQRRLNFKLTSLVDMASLVLGVAISITLAAFGLGARALVIGQLAVPATAAAIYLWKMPRVVPRWHRREARDITGFGVQSTMASLIFTAYNNVDIAVVNAQLGPIAAGYYWRAFQIGGNYQGKISQIMLRLALPVYARTGTLHELRRVRSRIVRMHATVIFPLLAVYVVVAPDLLPLVFGSRWQPAVVPSQILSFAGMTFALGTGTAALIIAAGRPKALLLNNVVQFGLYTATVLIFARYGLTTLCVAILVIDVLYYLASYYVLMYRIVGIPLSDLWREIGPTSISLLPLFTFGLLVRGVFVGLHLPPVATIPLAAFAGSAAYLITLRRFRDTWADVVLLAAQAVPPRLKRLRRSA